MTPENKLIHWLNWECKFKHPDLVAKVEKHLAKGGILERWLIKEGVDHPTLKTAIKNTRNEL